MKFLNFITISLFILESGCSHPIVNQADGEKKMPDLARFEAIGLGVTEETILRAFGKPDEIADLAPREDVLNFIYNNREYPQAFFVVDKNTKRLLSKSWEVLDGEAEQKIEAALNRYPQAHFKRRDAKFINPHVGPDEAWYEDRSIGISIEIRMARNEVDSISWFAPGTPPPPDPVCIKVRMPNGFVTCKQ